ncbi:ABC transporter ATP-binding protein [Paenibacillus mucilaginosus]|uniref:ABC transporter ATP binding protein n=1 Tax=Paenibacillus mucilaginosus (strain KNP414) TaxID=1036673 RepID=F8FEJ7_PAEMK|nr:ABC transporter ATP-binding protein [Paenibacillus mucilaginosus]AEI45314.1 ABC transporter ATP binding protein [Paenibacillus mucilaginosus KNP414]MCG7212803.1 ABC transporter ATP-binding protein [Paenibacillus mucilaginosus]WDM26772.1 ABC transporter ATP-binding protein [Paenibacillus mucilaginosus]WFA21482.1 ABC transporter ATP-binding protein [Paenibacillus mucilaginosus]
MAGMKVRGLGKRFGARIVLREIDLEVRQGEWLGILGPNGSGKSTLLHLLSGVEAPDQGSIELDGQPLAGYSRKALARLLAVLPQDALPPLGFTVREIVEMGRYPYQNWLGDEREDRSALVERILSWLKLEELQERTVDALSGGERQRVALGRALAQEPRLLLLDEPTTFLDIGYQLEMLERIDRWKEENGMTVVSVLHDLNLASMFCDRLLLLQEGRIRAIGTPEQVLQPAGLEEVYGTRPYVLPHPDSGVPQILLGRDRMGHE